MIIKDGLEYRNLEEQVLKNKQDIAEFKDSSIFLNGLGIHVLGIVSLYELPETADEFGDAYLVGVASPYNLYVWTRANPDAGEDEPYWVNLGNLAITGPQGAVGPKGDTGNGISNVGVVSYEDTSSYTKTTLRFYYTDGNSKTIVVQAKRGSQGIQGIQGIQGVQGPAGPAGPAGPRGDVGGFVHIIAKLNSTSELPSPSTLQDLTKAYLVGDLNELYIQVGADSLSAIWTNTGPLNVATLVTVNGEYQGTWEADTKADATRAGISGAGGLVTPVTMPTTKEFVGVDTSGAQIRIKLGNGLRWEGVTSPYTITKAPIYFHFIQFYIGGYYYNVNCLIPSSISTPATDGPSILALMDAPGPLYNSPYYIASGSAGMETSSETPQCICGIGLEAEQLYLLKATLNSEDRGFTKVYLNYDTIQYNIVDVVDEVLEL